MQKRHTKKKKKHKKMWNNHKEAQNNTKRHMKTKKRCEKTTNRPPKDFKVTQSAQKWLRNHHKDWILSSNNAVSGSYTWKWIRMWVKFCTVFAYPGGVGVRGMVFLRCNQKKHSVPHLDATQRGDTHVEEDAKQGGHGNHLQNRLHKDGNTFKSQQWKDSGKQVINCDHAVSESAL